ncbi:MAG TPA: ABC transporter ATP-binding protein, partial [Lacipirellulaceae bacterium]|nr:ABC transporter ATP-binding protein [Lacipirellulaceae bacterium]
MFKEELPLSVHEELDRRGLNGVPVVLCASSDLSLAGEPERNWVVATKDAITAVRETNVGVSLRETQSPLAEREENSLVVETRIPVADVREFRTQGAIGSGFLQAYVDDYWVDLARFPNTQADRFSRLARYLEDLRTGGDVQIDENAVEKITHCPKCGQRLPIANESCPRCIPRKAILSRLGQMLWPYRKTAFIMCGLMLVAVAAELTPPKLQQYLVDHILKGGQRAPDTPGLFAGLVVVVSSLAFARIMLSAVNFAKGRMATRVGVALTFDLRAKLVNKLHALGLDYYDRHQVGALTSRVAYDSEVIQSLLHQITGGFLLQIVQVTAVGVMLMTLNPKLAVYTLIPAPLVIVGSWFFWKRVHPKHYRYWDSSSKQAGMLTGMLSGIRVVKAFAQEDREYERFNKISDYLRACRMHVDYSTTTFSAIMQLIFSLGGLVVWYVGGHDVLAGTMSLGSMMAFLAYLAMFYTPLATLSQFTTWLTNFLTGCQRVFELLDTPVETCEPDEPVALPMADNRCQVSGDKCPEERKSRKPGLDIRHLTSDTSLGAIRFEKVSFGYERHQPVLRDIDFSIRPGETIGIVGKSGSGKTTLVNLLCRFYDVCEGRVLVDGIDVRRLASHDLRRHVGCVLQEPFLFRGTIWQNLVYGMPESTPEQAIAAAKAAQAHDFILNSSLGYDTWLGERGSGLSGGERQRMSIARAILYDPPILVLDEATSNVDAESEHAIQQALRALTKGRTTIAIAHRLSTLREADRILVFDRGRIVEQGSHDALIARNGKYANLVRLQG